MGTAAGIMFLDVKGYSNLEYQQLRDYHKNIYRALSVIIKKGEKGEKGRQGQPYVYKKTWGDGIVLAHRDMYKLATVALEIRDYFNDRKYEQDSDGALTAIQLLCRIAIHYAEFETIDDPIDGTKSCFGDAIILPARIEPVTDPGHVWATNLATHYIYNKQKDYELSQISWVYKGQIQLAKRFGENYIWEILKVGEKDPNDNEGTQDEPIIRIPADVKVQRPASAKPEVCEPIDDATATRIKAITGECPKENDITVCSKAPAQINECPSKAPSARVISEISRNGQAAVEECEASFWITSICESTNRVLMWGDSQKKAGTYFFSLLQQLSLDIQKFLKCLENMMKARGSIDTWPDTEDWPHNFLQWRMPQNYQGDPEVHLFIIWLQRFIEFYENLRNSNRKVSEIERGEIDPETEDCLGKIHQTSNYLAINLKDLGRYRINGTQEALREGLDSFDRFHFAEHLMTVIELLPLKTKSVRPVWA